jgi:hypothetical protein
VKFVSEEMMKDIFTSFSLKSYLVIYGAIPEPIKGEQTPKYTEWKTIYQYIEEAIFIWINWVFGKMEFSTLFNQMLKVEEVMLSCNLINKKTLHLFQVISREKDVSELDMEELEIIQDVNQMLLRDERCNLNNEEELSTSDTIRCNKPKSEEEKII